MMRVSTTVPSVMLLVIAWCVAPAGPASACEDGRSPAIAAGAESTPAVPPAPRAPRTPRSEAPPEAPEAPAPPTGFDLPEAPTLLTPRGWFGFGFQCAECSARGGSPDSGAVWAFGTHPTVYSVDSGSPAALAGLRRGDVITRIDGLSILSPDAGRAFGAIRPGQTVRWTVMRGDRQREIVARAAERPERRARVALTDLRRELARLNELSDMDELRRELAEVNREMEVRRAVDLAREKVRVTTLPARRLRYAGVIGGTEVEVRGPGSVIVSETDGRDELVITTGESVVVIRVPEGARKGAKQPPR